MAERPPAGAATALQSAKPKKLATRPLPPDGAAALARIEEHLGGRAGLVAALVLAPQSDALDRFLALLAIDPRGAGPKHHANARQVRHLADLCVSAGVLPRDVLKWVEQGQQAESLALSKAAAYKEAPLVAADVMRKAQPHERLCEDCHGRGYRNRLQQDVDDDDKPIGEPRLVRFPCTECEASGYVQTEAKTADVETALELAGLVAKSAAVQVTTTQQLNVNANLLHGSLPTLQRAVDQILHGDAFADEPPAIEAEVVTPAAPTLPAPPPPSAGEILL